MNFLADEHIDQPIVDRLRQDGHDVVAVAELEPGIADATILARANQGNIVLLTADTDFGELVFRQRQVTAGVVLIRLAGLSSRAKADIVSEVMRDHAAELLHAFTVISPGMVRIRPST